MRHARDADELLEIAGNELRTIVRDNAGLRFRVLFLGAFENYFDISFAHRLAQIPMHEETAEAIQNAAQIIEGAAQVDVGTLICQCWCGRNGRSKPLPLREGRLFHRDNNPACFNTRQTLAGLTATTSASSIMNVSRR